jgi:hypothetical protein
MTLKRAIRIIFRMPWLKRRRARALILPGLLILLIALSTQLGLQQRSIEAQIDLYKSLQRQTRFMALIDSYKEAALKIDPLAPPIEDTAATQSLRVMLTGGFYNLSHALNWNGIASMATLDKKQYETLRRVVMSCGLSSDLVIPLVEYARRAPVKMRPRHLLTLQDGNSLDAETLSQLAGCVEMRPFIARFEILHAEPKLGAAVLGIGVTDFIRIKSFIRDGVITNRSALKNEIQKITPDAINNIDFSILSLSPEPSWWTIDLLDSDRVFASFTIYQHADRKREIVATQILWIPEFEGDVL